MIDWAARRRERQAASARFRWAHVLVSNSPSFAEHYGPLYPEPWRTAVAQALKRYRETGRRRGFPNPTDPTPKDSDG